MLKIALVGYGAMGQVIESLAPENNIEIVQIFDINNPLTRDSDYNFDVAIEFSNPTSVIENISILAEKNIPVVVGTTGWYDSIDKVRSIVDKNNATCLWGSNFSIGMQMFFKITELASKMINKVDSYDIFANETHHTRKVDSPSGTAETIAQIITSNVDSKEFVQKEIVHGAIPKNHLHLSSTRGGFVPGTHTVYLDSLADTVELTHRARNRSGFAKGALLAANHITGKKGLIEFSELLDEIWS